MGPVTDIIQFVASLVKGRRHFAERAFAIVLRLGKSRDVKVKRLAADTKMMVAGLPYHEQYMALTSILEVFEQDGYVMKYKWNRERVGRSVKGAMDIPRASRDQRGKPSSSVSAQP